MLYQLYRRKISCLTICVLFALIGSLLPAQIAQAETIWSCSTGELINAINEANANGEADTIMLDGTCTYLFTNAYAADPDGYGPVALPPITSDITIEGNGAVLNRSGSNVFRFFYVTSAGSLTLKNLTLTNGLAQGGNGGLAQYDGGGGGAGLGGAIFNRGTLTLASVTLTNNTAQGGNGGDDTLASPSAAGGGGMGGNGQNAPGGNLGGRGGGVNGGAGGVAGGVNGGAGCVGGGGGGGAFSGTYGDGGNGGVGGGGGGGNT
ncbi:MAG: hypothetical protein JW934_03800, partial [Anaerolineae bacterium]|nr:hypothetical protein [Anaerolineae bacterium]